MPEKQSQFKANRQPFGGNPKYQALNPKLAFLTQHDLKKQSQFEPPQMNVSFFARKDYANEPTFSSQENKAKTKPIPRGPWGSGKRSTIDSIRPLNWSRKYLQRKWL